MFDVTNPYAKVWMQGAINALEMVVEYNLNPSTFLTKIQAQFDVEIWEQEVQETRNSCQHEWE